MSAEPDPGDVPDRRRFLGLGAGAAAGSLAACTGVPVSGDEPDDEAAEGRDRLDELFADLRDRSGEHAPISPAERAARRARLAGLLDDAGVDALICEAGATMTYLAGVTWGRSERMFGLVCLADGSHFWICPAFEASRARGRITAAFSAPGDEEAAEPALVPWDEHEYAFAPLAAELARRGVDRVAFDPRARLFLAEGTAEAHGARRVVSGRAIVERLRGVKDDHELALLRAANELTQEAITAVAERLEPGITDRELGTRMRRAQERLGLTGTWVLPLLNEDAALPHGSAGDAVLARGDLVLVDTGGSLHGYASDNTRTWIFDGSPSAEVERAWHTVRDAQRRAFEAIRPGRRCREIDAVARAAIAEAGYGAGYAALTHRLGHGIGLEGHEAPYLDGGSDVVLVPGMTFSDEPGIYVPGRHGIRIEDIVAVTDAGADHFGSWQPGPRFPS